MPSAVPVSSERNVRVAWMPLVARLDLRWVPSLATGVDVTRDDLGAVLGELSRLVALAQSELPEASSAEIARRAGAPGDGLARILRSSDVTVFIG